MEVGDSDRWLSFWEDSFAGIGVLCVCWFILLCDFRCRDLNVVWLCEDCIFCDGYCLVKGDYVGCVA